MTLPDFLIPPLKTPPRVGKGGGYKQTHTHRDAAALDALIHVATCVCSMLHDADVFRKLQ